MIFTPPLVPAVLIKRYKRFLADVKLGSAAQRLIGPLANNQDVTAHCANTGAMTNCIWPEHTVWLQHSSNPKRKHAFSWVLSQNPEGELIAVNTLLANQLTHEALLGHALDLGINYDEVKAEQPYGSEGSRIDFALLAKGELVALLEVKSVTLKLDDTDALKGVGAFPDAKTVRGQKHLRELSETAKQGIPSILLFVVMHQGIDSVQVASHIDPAYAELMKQALCHGLQVKCVKSELSVNSAHLGAFIPFYQP